MQKSIEAEYWVTDRDGALTTPGALTDESTYAEEEFVRPLFELKTPPCETCSELRATFVDQLAETLSRAAELDKVLVPLGTPLNGTPIDHWPGERTRIQRRVLGEDFAYAKYCAGTHVHFEKVNVTDQLNVLASLDPALALLNSSPYFRGERVAAGARPYVYRKQCYREFPMHGQLWEYVESVGQWERRLQRLFDEFKRAAVEAGVDEASVDEHFCPDDVVWTPVRLRNEMPTVEWRAPDATLPSETLRLAEELNAVMEHLHDAEVDVDGVTGGVTDDKITLPEFDVVRDHTEEAIHDGLQSNAVVEYLERMGFDVDAYDPVTEEIDGRGPITPDEARELRLRCGERLREDVNRLLRTH